MNVSRATELGGRTGKRNAVLRISYFSEKLKFSTKGQREVGSHKIFEFILRRLNVEGLENHQHTQIFILETHLGM